ncbi:spermine synthase-like [Lingula anatina]|uniref:Spermine synthase-like n=1 Tax=Lingula anatina TaxID=7574 RepID=A0A1S3HNN1_LINAN|nr:spermine synthase-like [Lingula anatina]|eukprot:XP_013387645.1 spermine synthase-like [Lingula anatina]
MTANTIMMCFKVAPSYVSGPEFQARLKKAGELALGELSSEPRQLEVAKDKLFIFTGTSGSHAVLRTYTTGLLTFDVQHFGEGDEYEWNNGKYDMEAIKKLKKNIEDLFGSAVENANSLYAPIRRGGQVWTYGITADERLMEPDYDKVSFETNSPWQNIKIMHSRELGNVLLLDDDIMLGESDLIYTQTLLGLGNPKRENYKGKEILILGGGDGGILHELLKENPKFVTMAEIDEEVIKACRVHMRSVCGDSMDKFEGNNYKIIIEDCIKVMKEDLEQGKKYDFVINDLTEFPVDKENYGFAYDFKTTHLVMELALQLLKPQGKVLARGNSKSAVDYYPLVDEDIIKLGGQFKRRDAYVPSFRETYCLYEIWKV